MSESQDNKGNGADPKANGKGNPPADPKAKDNPPAKDERLRCRFLPAGGKAQDAFINGRATNDINVAELEVRGEDGKPKFVQSVPRWNGQGERPPFDVWTQ